MDHSADEEEQAEEDETSCKKDSIVVDTKDEWVYYDVADGASLRRLVNEEEPPTRRSVKVTYRPPLPRLPKKCDWVDRWWQDKATAVGSVKIGIFIQFLTVGS